MSGRRYGKFQSLYTADGDHYAFIGDELVSVIQEILSGDFEFSQLGHILRWYWWQILLIIGMLWASKEILVPILKMMFGWMWE